MMNPANNRRWNELFFLFLIAYYGLTTIMPAIAQYLSAYIYMATVVGLFILITMRNIYTVNTYMGFLFPLLLLIILQTLNFFINKLGSLPLYIYGQIIFIIPALLIYFLFVTNNRKVITIVIIMMIAAYVITALTTYIGLLKNPDAARILATISDSNDPKAVLWGRMNIGGFETIYSIILLLPMTICLYKVRKLPLIPFIGILIIFFLCILESQYATAFILFCFSIILLVIPKKFSVRNVWLVIILLVCIYLIFKSFVSNAFLGLSNSVDSITLSLRFRYISDIIVGRDTSNDTDLRFQLYMRSINNFLKYPITGSWIFGRYGSGGHSFILDTLAEYGAIGGTALFIFLKHIFVKLYLPFKDNEFYGYLLWSFIVFLILSLLNPTGFLIVPCFINPGIAYLIQDKNYQLSGRVPRLESNVGL